MIPEKSWRCAAVALGLAACSPTLDWREVRAVEDAAVALFPCKPDRLSRDVALAGAKVQMHLASCTVQGVTYALGHAAVAEPAQIGPALAAMRYAAGANIGGQPTVLGAFAVPGMTPHPLAEKLEISGRGPDGDPVREQAAFFTKGMRVYQATIVGAAIDPDAADTFFSGLELSR
jgi:hypothetical protein